MMKSNDTERSDVDSEPLDYASKANGRRGVPKWYAVTLVILSIAATAVAVIGLRFLLATRAV